MTEPRNISLGGRTFAVPALPLRINRLAYPLCRKLSATSLIERCIAASGVLDCTDEELGDLVELAFLAASAADKGLTREAFDDLPVTPPELLDMLFAVRYQTGAWLPVEAPADTGEAQGA